MLSRQTERKPQTVRAVVFVHAALTYRYCTVLFLVLIFDLQPRQTEHTLTSYDRNKSNRSRNVWGTVSDR